METEELPVSVSIALYPEICCRQLDFRKGWVSKGSEKFYIRAGNMSQALSISKATAYIQSRFERA